ncbi:hypothetical protein GOODEAATRI_005174 [Goodea atripinnis]|uniref:Secreted protein n=1 Tax=Goodea atripinnis TaxID=208336 RepID=A0ABV0NI09_9TELE
MLALSLTLITILMVLFLFGTEDTVSVISEIKCGLIRPQHTFPLCFSPSHRFITLTNKFKMSSVSQCFYQGSITVFQPKYTMQYRVHFTLLSLLLLSGVYIKTSFGFFFFRAS